MIQTTGDFVLYPPLSEVSRSDGGGLVRNYHPVLQTPLLTKERLGGWIFGTLCFVTLIRSEESMFLLINSLDPSQVQDDRFLKSVIKLLTYLLIELNLINSIKKKRVNQGFRRN